MKLLIADV